MKAVKIVVADASSSYTSFLTTAQTALTDDEELIPKDEQIRIAVAWLCSS